ncbi:MAG: HAMP domain-containing histidine kinase [Muribaculaceae bacterium]|nr:HAMP domain-containing histidine kinase [Muribaculaceae bacterium]
MSKNTEKFRLSYSARLMVMILGLCCMLVAVFMVFQYERENEYASQLLNARLQLLNTTILDHLEDGYTPDQWIPGLDLPFKSLRITLVDKQSGEAVYDNVVENMPKLNYLTLPEIKAALENEDGKAFVNSLAPSNNEQYFFSTQVGSTMIVRTGVPPFSVSVGKFLDGDRTFLWVMALALAVVGVLTWFATRAIGGTIKRLQKFARDAEGGVRIYDTEDFPNDELGSIAQTIVRLYVRLQQTTAERDRQQLMLMEEEENKQRIKRELTNNINHELKTPVASVQVTLETLIDYPDLPEEKRMQLLLRCESNARRLVTLLRDISTITRMDDGNSLIGREEINVSKVVEDIVEDSTPRAADKGMKIYCTLPPVVNIKGNAGLLESIFRNLIENAIAYSGGSKLTISMLEASPEMYTIIVADNGSGIAEEHLPRLFERFYRIDKGRSRQMGGTGLGLAIVKNAAQFHGGDVTVSNRSTGGLEFIITFPREAFIDEAGEEDASYGKEDKI